jgi:hypothetical protein
MLTARTFGAAAGFSFFIQLAQPIDITRCGHEVKFLGRERRVVELASAGIIAKAPALSTEWTTMSPKQLVKVALRVGSRYYSRKQASDKHSRKR